LKFDAQVIKGTDSCAALVTRILAWCRGKNSRLQKQAFPGVSDQIVALKWWFKTYANGLSGWDPPLFYLY
jgi:hypothetical protein